MKQHVYCKEPGCWIVCAPDDELCSLHEPSFPPLLVAADVVKVPAHYTYGQYECIDVFVDCGFRYVPASAF